MTVDAKGPLLLTMSHHHQQQQLRKQANPFDNADLVVHRHPFSVSKSPGTPTQRKRASSVDGTTAASTALEEPSVISSSPRRRKKVVSPPPPPAPDANYDGHGHVSLSHLNLERGGEPLLSPNTRLQQQIRAHASAGNLNEQDERQQRASTEQRRRRRRESRSQVEEHDSIDRLRQQQQQQQEQGQTSAERRGSPSRISARHSHHHDLASISSASTTAATVPKSPLLSSSQREERSILRRQRRKSEAVDVIMPLSPPPPPVISSSIHSPRHRNGGGDYFATATTSVSPRRARRQHPPHRASTTETGFIHEPQTRSMASRSLSPGTLRHRTSTTSTPTSASSGGDAVLSPASMLSPRAMRKKRRALAELAAALAPPQPPLTESLSPENVSAQTQQQQQRRRHRASTTDSSSPATISDKGDGNLSSNTERRRHGASTNGSLPQLSSLSPHDTTMSLKPEQQRRRLVTPTTETRSPERAATRPSHSKSPSRSSHGTRSMMTTPSPHAPTPTPQQKQRQQSLALSLELPVTSPMVGDSHKESVRSPQSSHVLVEHPMSSPPTSASNTERKNRRRRHRSSSPAVKSGVLLSPPRATTTDEAASPLLLQSTPKTPRRSRVARHSTPNIEAPPLTTSDDAVPSPSSPHRTRGGGGFASGSNRRAESRHSMSSSPTRATTRSLSRSRTSKSPTGHNSGLNNKSLQQMLKTDANAEQSRNNTGEDRSISLRSEPALSSRPKHHSSSNGGNSRPSSRSRGVQSSRASAMSSSFNEKRTSIPSSSASPGVTTPNLVEHLLEGHGSRDRNLAGKDDWSFSMQAEPSLPAPPPNTATTPPRKRSSFATKMEPKSPVRPLAPKGASDGLSPSKHASSGSTNPLEPTNMKRIYTSPPTSSGGLTLKEELEQLLQMDLSFGATPEGGDDEENLSPVKEKRSSTTPTSKSSLTHYLSVEASTWTANRMGDDEEDQSLSLKSEPPLSSVKSPFAITRKKNLTRKNKHATPLVIGTTVPPKIKTGSDSNLNWTNSCVGNDDWGEFATTTSTNLVPTSPRARDTSISVSPFDAVLKVNQDWEKSLPWPRQGQLGDSWQSAPPPTSETNLSAKDSEEDHDNNGGAHASYKSLGHALDASKNESWTNGFEWNAKKTVNEPSVDLETQPSPKTPSAEKSSRLSLKKSVTSPTKAVLESLEESIVWSHSFSVPEEIVSPKSECTRLTSSIPEGDESCRWHNSSNFSEFEVPGQNSFHLLSPTSTLRRASKKVKSAKVDTGSSPCIDPSSEEAQIREKVAKSLGNFFDVSRWQSGSILEERSIALTSLKSEPLPNPTRRSFSAFDSGLSAVTEPPRSSKPRLEGRPKPPRSSTKNSAKLGAFLDSRWQTTEQNNGEEEKSIGHRSLKSEPPMPIRKESDHNSAGPPHVASNELRSPHPGRRDRDGSKASRISRNENPVKLGSFLDDSRWDHGGRAEEEASVGHRSFKSEPPISPMRTSSNGGLLFSAKDKLKLPFSAGGEIKSPIYRKSKNGKHALKAFFDDSRWKSCSPNLVDDDKSQGHISLQSEPPYTPTRRSSFINKNMSQSVAAYLPSPPTTAESEERATKRLSKSNEKKKKGEPSLEAFFDDSRWKSSSDLGFHEERSVGQLSLKSEPPINPLRKNSIVKLRSASVAGDAHNAKNHAKSVASKSRSTDASVATTWDEDVELLLGKCEEQLNIVFRQGTQALDSFM
jgi:hypothetical protein